ncbi:MAG: DUF2249 domain-containing protein [Bacteroidetes bacterium]|jgi:uncharacterized protein (DUF2249 family)|nr:DUF2249 domain-containing protein [Bacteroidota bacterium]
MITINANTKIATLLKQHPDALEAIISISPKFNKLRNPLLRKLMAGRTSISMASKIGGCTVNDFFEKLQPLGFSVDSETKADETTESVAVPEFLKNISAKDIAELDVRPVLESGKDPLNLILEKLKPLQSHQVLKLINNFEPIPLIQLLEKQGYQTYTEIIDPDLYYTYFNKTEKVKNTDAGNKAELTDWDEKLKYYEGKLKTIDVRALEMPLPMLTILDELEKLPETDALYVYHKRIPVFLLPELKDRNFEFRIKEITDGEVYLLIFKS